MRRSVACSIRIACTSSLLLALPTLGLAGTSRAETSAGDQLADYLLVTNVPTTPAGSAPWFSTLGTFEGRVHTNGEMRFAGNPAFTDTVSSSGGKAWFFNNGAPLELDSDHNGVVDVPVFAKGFVRSAPWVVFPTHAWNQQTFALANVAAPMAPTNNMINQYLGFDASSALPPNGIYVPQSGGTPIGGIYIQGDLTQLRLWADMGTGQQWLRLTQGSAIRSVLVDRALGLTKVWNSTSTSGPAMTTLVGTPPSGVIYVSGSILDLRGPDRVSGLPPPAIARTSQMQIAAEGDIVIRRDLVYDAPDSSANVLGLYTPGGAVRIGTDAPDDLRLDAFILATSESNGQFTVDNWDTGPPRGTLHLRGGVYQNFFGPFSSFSGLGVLQTGYAREFRHDDRGCVPPTFATLALRVLAAPPHVIAGLQLEHPFPNPALTRFDVRYTLPRDGDVHLGLFDIAGRRVASIVDGAQRAGDHHARWSADRRASIAPGVYFVRLDQGRTHVTRRVVVLD